MKHLNINVYGTVQGVYFRDSTKAVADQLSITGFIKNMPDGSVYIEAEGDEFSLEQLLEWCNDGPDRAVVDRVDHTESELKYFNNFIVNR
jgi:acylphosphatase